MPDMPPRIAFCTTVKNRTQHLRQTLPVNLWNNTRYPNCVFVILDYNSGDDLESYIRTTYELPISEGYLVYYKMPDAGTFKMAHAKNVAHRCGILEGADILVNLDADGFTGPEFAQWIAHAYEFGGKRMFLQAMWNRWVDALAFEHQGDAIVFTGKEKEWLAQEPDGRMGPPVPKGCNGRVVCTVPAFLEAGGYDEKYETWGPDDKDFNIRLRRLGYEPELIPRQYLNTLLHNNKVRFREYPEAEATHGHCFQITVHDSDETIANFGNFGCGVVYRNFDPTPITLGPLPTRIFGIGMHKTATTSLHLALRKLGFDSAHWTSAHWAKAIWREMNNTGKSPTMEKHYAVCDLPFTLLYRKLDQAYPGSKFILTMLSDEAWIRSAELHWDERCNPMRANWDNDPFSNRIHEVLYGRRDFDRDVFLARYRHHNRDVLQYFKDRPDDLLVMNMSELADWQAWGKLCGFLGKPVPNTPYPHGNRDASGRAWIHAGDL